LVATHHGEVGDSGAGVRVLRSGGADMRVAVGTEAVVAVGTEADWIRETGKDLS
jgi:hypothetical protein